MTTKGMSPLRSLAQSSPRKAQHQDGSSIENSHDLGSRSASSIPCRAPLCPIPLPSQLTEGMGNGDTTSKGKLQVCTPRGKSKMQQRADSSGGTPDRHTSSGAFSQSRNRFGWHQPRLQVISGMDRECSSMLSSPTGKHGQESPCSNDVKDFRTPSKLIRSSSFSEAFHSSDGVGASEGQLSSTCLHNLNKAGNSNQSTPRSARSLKANDPNITGSSQLNVTPNRNVSRSLKYSANNVLPSSGALSARLGIPGSTLRGPVSQQARAAHPHSSDYQSVDVPYFELEEDPLFWNDHNVQVLIRCRPLSSSEITCHSYTRCLKQDTAHTLTWIGQPESRFTFDHVACEKITQEKLFKIAGIPMVDNCMSGYNSCMFAYGQTGSGKTHTMLGDIGELEQRPSDNRGMTPRIFEYLFGQISVEEKMRKNEHLKFTCKCSFLEIYNEQISDLLEPSSTNLQMREDLKKGVYVENLSEVEVKSVQDVVILLLQGAANRRVAATNMNQESSRSHSVFTCVIESKWESESMTNIRFGRLNLVDLAGSERQKSSGAEGERLKEAANINKSLSTLGLVIMILVDVAQGKQRHVPYRDSKLTFLLQDSLGGNSKTTIIANVSPSVSCASETLSTLKFAQRAKFIRNNAVVNEDASGDVLALRLQIQQLKEELNRLSRQSISRIPLSSGVMLLESSRKEIPDHSSAIVNDLSKPGEKGESYETNLEKVKALEAVVLGSLRREMVADNTAKRLTGEIEQLNCLVRQREDDAQFNRMMLRFREDKIKRLEATFDGALSEEFCRSEEVQALKEELDLLRGRLDKNPELTRFAMENIRLREQIQRLQDFYVGGDREILLEEISCLRDQFSEYLEAKLAGDNTSLQQSSEKIYELKDPKEHCFSLNNCEEGSIISKLETLLQEKEARIEWEAYRADALNCQLEDARLSIEVLENKLKDSKEARDTLANRLQVTEANLAAAQETATSAQASIKQIRLETEDIALQQRLSFTEIQEATTAWRLQELQLRSQLEDAENMIKELSMKQERVPENESFPNAAQTIMQLQMELEALDCLIQEERSYRKEAEENIIILNKRLDQSEEEKVGLRAQIGEAEARFDSLSIKFEEAEEKELETSKKLLESAEDLNNHKLVVESLEHQSLIAISEINNLQTQNNSLTEALKSKEDELKLVTGCVVFLQSELQRELELRVLEMDTGAVNDSSTLKEKLERTRKALEQAEQLNSKLQNEQSFFETLEHEKELVRADVERETTEVITVLQSDLISLCEDRRLTQERGSKAEQKVEKLKTDVAALQTKVKALSEENVHLNYLYQNLLKEKDSEVFKLTQEWEMATSNLIVCLSEGNQALDEAAQEIDIFSEESLLHGGNVDLNVESLSNFKEKNLVEVLERRLLHVHKLAKHTEDKVRILSDASLAIADMQRQEKTNMQNEVDALKVLLVEKSNYISCQHANVQNLKGRALKGEKMFLAACLIINKFSETGKDLHAVNQKMQHIVDNIMSSTKEKEGEINSLQLQRRQDKALLEDREALILRSKELTKNLSEKIEDLICQRKVMESNYLSLKHEQQMAKTKCEMAEETCAMLFGELHQANASMNESIVTVVEVQMLEDLLSCQENLLEENLLQSRSMFCKAEAQYQACIKDLTDRVCLLEAKNEALLVDLTNERNLLAHLRKDARDNSHKLSMDLKILEKEFLADQGQLQQQFQESCQKVDSLESQNAFLLDELNQRKFSASEFEASLQKLLSESSAGVLAVLESWSKDKIAAVIEAELLNNQVCLMEEDHLILEKEFIAGQGQLQESCRKVDSLENQIVALQDELNQKNLLVSELQVRLQKHLSESSVEILAVLDSWSNDKIAAIVEAEFFKYQVRFMEEDRLISESQLESSKKDYHDHIAQLERESMALTQRITETDVVVQKLKEKLQSSDLQLQRSKLQAEQTGASLSMHLGSLSEEFAAVDFSKAVQMEVIECVLQDQIQFLKDRCLALMLDVIETKDMAAELARKNSDITANVEEYITEIASLKLQNSAAEDAMASLTEKLSHSQEQLQLEKTYTEQAQVRCDHLVYHSSCIEEKFSLDIFVLVLEEAILKEMLVSQEDLLVSEANFSQRHMQMKLDSLTSENVHLVNQVNFAEEVAQHCATESKGLFAELKSRREQKFDTEVEESARDGLNLSQTKGPEGEFGTGLPQDKENRFSDKQRVEHTLRDLLDIKENLQNCYFEVDLLIKERNRHSGKMRHAEHLAASVLSEVEISHGEFKQIQLAFSEMDECVLESLGLSQIYANFLTEARSVTTKVKEEHNLLQKQLHQNENEVLKLQIQLHQSFERFANLENMHQLLEQVNKKNEEELTSKKLSECHLQAQISHVSELAETLDEMYKDVSAQLHSRNSEYEQLQQQQQDSLKLVSTLYQEKELLEEELKTRISKMMPIDMPHQSDPVRASQRAGVYQFQETLASPKNLLCDVDKLNLSNRELKAEVERQRGDMECLQHELRKSCDIVSEVKHAHSKTLEVLQEREQAAEKLRAEVEAICASTWVLEKEVEVCKEQVEVAWKKVEVVLDEKKKLEANLLERDHTVKKLQVGMAVLQEHVGLATRGLDDKQIFIEKLEDELSHLQQSLMLARTRLTEVESNNVQLRSEAQEFSARKEMNEADLQDQQHAIQMLEMQLLNLNSMTEQRQAFSLDKINCDEWKKALKERDLAFKERDELHAELVVRNEELEMAQQLAEEHEAIAVEARQIAETSKTRAEKKEEEAKFLERSIEELESTVNALETQVGLVKVDAERQRLMREDTEMELQALRHQMSIMQARQTETGCDCEQLQRDLEKKSMAIKGKLQLLEKQCDEKNEQIRKYQKEIMEIMSKADKQASDHQQIIKTLENLAELKPISQIPSNLKQAERSAIKPRGSGSPFKCIGSGLSHQLSFEIDEELSCNRQKIDELEALANSRQKEIFLLNLRLAEAESMTHDVIRDLVGVKLDITNYATVMNHQQVHRTTDKSLLQVEHARDKDKELSHLRTQLNQFIEERESWLEEINRRQAEMMTARVAAEKLRQRDQLLSTENEALKMENASQRSRVFELEEEVNKLSGQQNLQQRIHHHAKIKDENNQLRMKNEDLATKLRRSEALLNRVAEELARYREAEGRTPYIDVEEEHRLKAKLEEVEEEKMQLAQELLTLCTSVLQVAGLTSSKVIDHTVAAEALKHLQNRLDTAEREVSDMKLKNKIESEKRRLSELRSLHSPLRTTISAAAMQCNSPYS